MKSNKKTTTRVFNDDIRFDEDSRFVVIVDDFIKDDKKTEKKKEKKK